MGGDRGGQGEWREGKRERTSSHRIDCYIYIFPSLLTCLFAHAHLEQNYIEHGSFEVRVFAAVPEEGGILLDDLKDAVGAQVFGVGYKQAMQQKWIAVEKGWWCCVQCVL